MTKECYDFKMAPHSHKCGSDEWVKYCKIPSGEIPHEEYLNRTTLNGFGQFTEDIASLAYYGVEDAIEDCLQQKPCELL